MSEGSNAENAGGNHGGTVGAPGNSNHLFEMPQTHIDLS